LRNQLSKIDDWRHPQFSRSGQRLGTPVSINRHGARHSASLVDGLIQYLTSREAREQRIAAVGERDVDVAADETRSTRQGLLFMFAINGAGPRWLAEAVAFPQLLRCTQAS